MLYLSGLRATGCVEKQIPINVCGGVAPLVETVYTKAGGSAYQLANNQVTCSGHFHGIRFRREHNQLEIDPAASAQSRRRITFWR